MAEKLYWRGPGCLHITGTPKEDMIHPEDEIKPEVLAEMPPDGLKALKQEGKVSDKTAVDEKRAARERGLAKAKAKAGKAGKAGPK